MTWIAVTERLPARYEHILVYFEEFGNADEELSNSCAALTSARAGRKGRK